MHDSDNHDELIEIENVLCLILILLSGDVFVATIFPTLVT